MEEKEEVEGRKERKKKGKVYISRLESNFSTELLVRFSYQRGGPVWKYVPSIGLLRPATEPSLWQRCLLELPRLGTGRWLM